MPKTATLNPPRREACVADATAPRKSPLPQPRFVSATLGFGLAGALLLWAAFPPLNLPWLAWIAPVPWLWLTRLPQLPGRRPYLALWLAGSIFWLLLLQGIRLAHPALYAGWIALSLYLAAYLPIFVGLTRIAVHCLKAPLSLAAPTVWVGLEVIRGYFLTGFSIGLLAHTQAEFPLLIQISDLAGGYTLSFVIMLVAAAATQKIPLQSRSSNPQPQRLLALSPLLLAAAAIAITLTYGWWRLHQIPPGSASPAVRIALIQGSLDTVFAVNAEQHEKRRAETYEQYRELTNRVVTQQPNLDLVIWPESMFPDPELRLHADFVGTPESGLSSGEVSQRRSELEARYRSLLAAEVTLANANTASPHPGTLLLVGTSTLEFGSAPAPRVYNAALLANGTGEIVGRYYKTHPVMFGEYIPFADSIPLLYKITPMTGGLAVGDGPQVFDVVGLKLSPSICFESTVPHLIRGQLRELARRGTPADILVNVTNDGWFWGSSILDLHFRCNVFRAVENRKPLVVAANTGISTWIDGQGLIRARGPRRQPQILLAEVRPDCRPSPYNTLGDWPAWLCATLTLALAALGLRQKTA